LDTPASFDDNVSLRFMLVYDSQPNQDGSLPQYSDVIRAVGNAFSSANTLDGLCWENQRRFRILLDEQFLTSDYSAGGTTSSDMFAYSDPCTWYFDFHVPCYWAQSVFIDNNDGSFNRVATGAYYVVTSCDDTTNPTTGTFQAMTCIRTYFQDVQLRGMPTTFILC